MKHKNPKHLAFIRTLPCVIKMQKPVQAAHIRIGGLAGMARKPPDYDVLPLFWQEHDKQEAGTTPEDMKIIIKRAVLGQKEFIHPTTGEVTYRDYSSAMIWTMDFPEINIRITSKH